MNSLYIITGPAGVGKSTISNIIAEKLSKSAVIEGDEIYHMVRGGYVSAWKEGNQLGIFWQNSIDLMINFLKEGYDVVFNYIVHKEDVTNIKKALEKIPELKIKFVVLMTDEKTIIKRDNLRPEDCRMGERSLVLLDSFKKQNFDKKFVLDTSKLSEGETADIIMECDFNI